MSDFDTMPSRATELSDSDKARGRIPKHAWGYVRGQYELNNRTYEDIGNEFNCTPSAVFYVVKQAGLRGIPPVLELPENDVARAEASRVVAKAKADSQWQPRRAEPEAPKAPSQVELMAEQANAMLEDEQCKRLFDATSNTILQYVAFKTASTETAKKDFKEMLHELRRAIASIELKVEMASISPPAPSRTGATETASPAQLSEIA